MIQREGHDSVTNWSWKATLGLMPESIQPPNPRKRLRKANRLRQGFGEPEKYFKWTRIVPGSEWWKL